MRIGYCSPLSSVRSDISDFSEALLPALKGQMEVVIFSALPSANPAIAKHFEIHALSELDDAGLRDSLDLIVYQISNNADDDHAIIEMCRKYPGVIELRDISLHRLAAEEAERAEDWERYVALAEYCHGKQGKQIAQDYLAGKAGKPWEEHPLDMCMNRHILEQGTAIIVHSDMARQVVLSVRPSVPVQTIPLPAVPAQEPLDQLQARCRKALMGLSRKKKSSGHPARRAHPYALESLSPEVIAARYKAFFEQVLNHTWQPDWEDLLVDRLMELGLTDPDYTAHLSALIQPLSPTDDNKWGNL